MVSTELLGARLERVEVKLDKHGKILEEHSKVLEEHSKVLEKHGEMLEEHGRILKEHGVRFDRIDERFDRLEASIQEMKENQENFERVVKAGFERIDKRFAEFSEFANRTIERLDCQEQSHFILRKKSELHDLQIAEIDAKIAELKSRRRA